MIKQEVDKSESRNKPGGLMFERMLIVGPQHQSAPCQTGLTGHRENWTNREVSLLLASTRWSP